MSSNDNARPLKNAVTQADYDLATRLVGRMATLAARDASGNDILEVAALYMAKSRLNGHGEALADVKQSIDGLADLVKPRGNK